MTEKEKIENAIKSSNTYRDALLTLNRNTSGASYKWLQRKIKLYEISISHFLSHRDIMNKSFSNGRIRKNSYDELFIENSKAGRGSVKNFILRNNLMKYECVKCGNKGEWLGIKITLILDHINGINNDNRINNLRFLCPNCNATTETNCLGSVGVEKKIKKQKIKEEKSTKLSLKRKMDKPEHRKVIRPSKEELFELLKTNTYVALGEKYGVSDVAIHKWQKRYLEQQI